MSCGCGKLPEGTFSSQKDTWTRKSDLRMSSWDPYPELENPKNCYGTNVSENYCNTNCGLYKVEQNKIDTNYIPLQRSVIVGGTVLKNNVETYNQNNTVPWTRPTAYNNLKSTWGVQQPYTL
jgi:hypothetical protein